MLKASAFADQMAMCTSKGACFITNDACTPFAGSASVTLRNVVTAQSQQLMRHNVTLPAGAGVVEWFCGTPTTTLSAQSRSGRAAVSAHERADYTPHLHMIPADRANVSMTLPHVTRAVCETRCDEQSACLGFTQFEGPGDNKGCYLYTSVVRLMPFPRADWWQKPGTAPIPGGGAPPPSPSPPMPPPPAQMGCASWGNTTQWKALMCGSNGASCILEIEVTEADSDRPRSWSVLPFQPPKAMRLPPATVTAQVGQLNTSGSPRVAVSLSATATALYVTLTTLAEGRFEDNAFRVLPGNDSATTAFVPWGYFGPDQLELLRSTLRVEHLQENL